MPRMSRRTFLFLAGAGVAVAGGRVRAQRPARVRYPIGFSTLGCPQWPWARVLAEADRLGCVAIELRGLEGEMDLTKRPEFVGERLQASRRDLDAVGLRVVCLGSSASMHLKEPAPRAAALDEGRRFIDLAHAMRVPYVRVFGDSIAQDEPRDVALGRVAEGFRALADHAGPAGVTVIQETHGDFVRASDVADVARRVDSPAFGVLWDVHHSFVGAGESPAETLATLGALVRHTHLKDSVPSGTGRRYVPMGAGGIPVRETVRLLAARGYAGVYGFEWEKRWHPEIEEPEAAFPHFARVMTEYLADAGVRPA